MLAVGESSEVRPDPAISTDCLRCVAGVVMEINVLYAALTNHQMAAILHQDESKRKRNGGCRNTFTLQILSPRSLMDRLIGSPGVAVTFNCLRLELQP